AIIYMPAAGRRRISPKVNARDLTGQPSALDAGQSKATPLAYSPVTKARFGCSSSASNAAQDRMPQSPQPHLLSGLGLTCGASPDAPPGGPLGPEIAPRGVPGTVGIAGLASRILSGVQ